MRNKDLEKIKRLISINKTKEAIDSLLNINPTNEVINLSGRFHLVSEQMRNGVITYREFNQGLNPIRISLLGIVDIFNIEMKPENIINGNILHSIVELNKHLVNSFSINDKSKLIQSQLMIDETLKYANEISIEDINKIVAFLPECSFSPILLHNITDLLIEAQGKHNKLEGMEDEITRVLRGISKDIAHHPTLPKISILELLGCLGLAINRTEFFEKYLDLIIENYLTRSSYTFRSFSWWTEKYFGNKQNALSHFEGVRTNDSYNLVEYHANLLTASFNGSKPQEVIEKFSVKDSIGNILKKLEKIEFKD